MSALPPGDDERAIAGSVIEFAGSDLFLRTFEEGMAMVEETAAYLDGAGRQESRHLPQVAALAYAGESMRLTTRLMQVASWLLVQRSVYDGEMSKEDAASDKYRLGSKEICHGRPVDGAEQLPLKLLDLLVRSKNLYDRVERLDDQLYSRGSLEEPAGLNDRMRKLETAFGGPLGEED